MTEKDKCGDVKTQTQKAVRDNAPASNRIGILGNYPDTGETRFLLTPEACGLLTSSGLKLWLEAGAGVDISFPDESYTNYGVEIVSRKEALGCEIVLSYAPISAADVMRMAEGSVLLCMMDNTLFEKDVIQSLLDRKITLGCFDNMLSHNSMPVFADIIDEIDGRASVIYAQDYLSFLGGGKGVLLAGVAGINPCEILVIGDGNEIYSACAAAIDAGAYVTLMNNDVSALMTAKQLIGPGLNTAVIHPRVLYNKVKTADVIMLGECTRPFEMPKKLSVAMKENVYVLDFEQTHPSVTVPRTVAMALSNVLVNFFDEMIMKEGFEGMLATTPGVQCGMVTYKGKLVDKLIASYLSMPSVDINVMLTAAN